MIRDRVEATALLTAGPSTVTGVTIAPAGGGEPEHIPADLVVDATGKVSMLPQWLAELGYPAPMEETVECRMAYLSRRWKLADDVPNGDLVTICTPAAQPHFGVMIAQEDGTHIVTLGGLLDQRPARSEDAYLAFARGLPDGAIAERLAGATPVTDLQPSQDVAWKLSTSGDLRYPDVVGRRTADMKMMNRYLDRVTARAGTDPVLARTVLLVAGFVKPPQSFFAPSVLWRALRPRRAAAPALRPAAPVAPSPVAG